MITNPSPSLPNHTNPSVISPYQPAIAAHPRLARGRGVSKVAGHPAKGLAVALRMAGKVLGLGPWGARHPGPPYRHSVAPWGLRP